MFCCKPDSLCYYTVNLDPNLALFEQDEDPVPLNQKFKQKKTFLYLPKTMYFSAIEPSVYHDSQLSQPQFKGEYQLSFSDQTRQLLYKQLVPKPITKLWRVLTSNQSQTLNQADQFSFDSFNFEVYHLPKPRPTLSNQVTYLTDPEDKCRICFGNDTTELNPILNFCKCSGSIKYMHLDCCRQWIQEGSQTMEGALYALHVFYNGHCNICKQPWKKKIKQNKKDYLLFDFEPKFHQEDDPILGPPEVNKEQNIIFFLSSNEQDYESEDDSEGNYVLIFKLRLPEIINPQEEYSFRIGKSFEQCDIVFEHIMIGSPIQCEFQYKNNKLTIKDMNSNEGTNVLLKNSKKKNFNTKEGLYFRHLDTVYHIRGQKYVFACFQSNITYTIKYQEFKQTLAQ